MMGKARVGLLGAVAAGVGGLIALKQAQEHLGSTPRVSVINLHGAIMAGKNSPLSSSKIINLDETRELIDKAFAPKRLEAVLLNINSPGGSAVQSDLISSYIKEKSLKHGIPVIAFVEDTAASGGYWLACTGEQIFANRCSLIGSIGAISMSLGFHQLIKEWGIESRVFTAGENKAVLNPLTPLKEKDVEIIKGLLNNVHQHFIDHVKDSRKDKLKSSDDILFSGEFWTGELALAHGLIDGIDSMESYIARKYGDNVNVIRIESVANPLQKLLGGGAQLGSTLLAFPSSGPEMIDHKISDLGNKLLR